MSFILNVQNVQHFVCSLSAEQELICIFFLLRGLSFLFGTHSLGFTPLGVVGSLCNWLKTVQHQPKRIAAELPPSKKKEKNYWTMLDYASTVWHNPLKDKTHLKLLRTVQRAALIRTLSAFKTVATPALEVESHVLPTHLRLKQRAQITIARLSTLLQDHPIHEVMARARKRSTHMTLTQLLCGH